MTRPQWRVIQHDVDDYVKWLMAAEQRYLVETLRRMAELPLSKQPKEKTVPQKDHKNAKAEQVSVRTTPYLLEEGEEDLDAIDVEDHTSILVVRTDRVPRGLALVVSDDLGHGGEYMGRLYEIPKEGWEFRKSGEYGVGIDGGWTTDRTKYSSMDILYARPTKAAASGTPKQTSLLELPGKYYKGRTYQRVEEVVIQRGGLATLKLADGGKRVVSTDSTVLAR